MRSYPHGFHNHSVKRNQDQGFTLIEILFAVAVLSFGLLAISSLQGSAIKGNLMALDRTEAVAWAQTQMESLMALPFNDVVTGGPTVRDNYTISWVVVAYNPPYTVGTAKMITVTVNYSEKGIARRPVVLQCIKPNV